MENWYNLGVDETLQKTGSDKRGLSSEDAAARITKYGKNSLSEGKKNSWLALFLMQFTDLMTLLLIGSAAVSGAVAAITKDGSDLVDTFIIVFIIFLNAIVGFIQQYRADKAIEKLKRLSEAEIRVYRDGKLVLVPSSEITVGDVIELKCGDVVPADCRIITADGFSCDESSLTGENEACVKNERRLGGTRSLGDRKNMVFGSTFAVSGRAICVVTEIGENTEIGQIARSISCDKPPKSPLEKSLDVLGRVISISVIAVAIIVFVCSIFEGRSGLIASFMSAVAIAVAAIPEGLPAVVTIIMAMGVQKMSKVRVVIRKLHAVETLGSCSCICSDKTGTLTENRMMVEKLAFVGGEGATVSPFDKEAFYNCASLCHSVTGEYPDISGDATERAIIDYLRGNGVEWNRSRDGCIPFSSEKRMMSVKKGSSAYHKGGFDVIISKCDRYLFNGKEYKMTREKRAEILWVCESMAKNALRVIAFAYNECDGAITQNQMVFVSVAGLFDPPKQGVREAVEECRVAGIRAVMITGDHVVTAAAVAERIGIDGAVMTGEKLDSLSGEERKRQICAAGVFARVSPSHKREIVETLQSAGEVVAMTGDGINDAPGLKKADIGVAMGKSGTDVTKNAADMVIADDNFSTIVGAVREGRRIFANIRKTICFFLATNAAEVLTVLVATLAFFGHEFLRPTQLLWINLVTDSFPVLAFGVEKAEDDVMKKPPQNAVKSLWNLRTVTDIVFFGIMQTVLTIAAFYVGLSIGGDVVGGTMAFLTMSFAELLHSLNVRSDDYAVKKGFRGNAVLFATVLMGIVLSIALCYVPYVSEAFELTVLGLNEWIAVSVLSLAVVPLGDLYKLLIKTIGGRKTENSMFCGKTAKKCKSD